MKKILIITTLVVLSSSLQVQSACDVNKLESCKANLGSQNQTIKNKLVPNNLKQMSNPTRDSSREFKHTPHSMPENITNDSENNPRNKSISSPYNADCQFGVCLPGKRPGLGASGR